MYSIEYLRNTAAAGHACRLCHIAISDLVVWHSFALLALITTVQPPARLAPFFDVPYPINCKCHMLGAGEPLHVVPEAARITAQRTWDPTTWDEPKPGKTYLGVEVDDLVVLKIEDCNDSFFASKVLITGSWRTINLIGK